MLQLRAFRRSIGCLVLALGSVAIVAAMSPASASPHRHHGARRHVHGRHHVHSSHHGRRQHRQHSRHRTHRGGYQRQVLGWDDRAQRLRSRGLENARASIAPAPSAGFSASGIVAEARRFIGGNPTGRSRLWCARFMNMVLRRTGHRGTGSDMARSFASYGHRVSGPRVGAIAVMGRRGGGHVGVVSGIDSRGNPIVVSGNHGHRVAESVYPRSRIYAYVMPEN